MIVRAALALLWLVAASAGALAQGGSKNVPNALQGFSQNRDQPVQIEAASLEVRDKSGVATFSGNVKVVQGDTTMRCKSLVVYYQSSSNQDEAAPAMKSAKPGPGGAQSISRLEAKGGVTVTQKDQTATGDSGLFDMKTNTVTLLGNVVVSQGKNVMRGERLVVDLTNGTSRVESKANEPVRMLIQQNPSGGGNSMSPMGNVPQLGRRPAHSN